jgi:hypothetical protein
VVVMMPNDPSKPSSSEQHPLIGWMRGTVIVEPGVDLTEPADPRWGQVAYGDRTRDDFKDRKR